MVKILNYLYVKKSYGILSKGAIFFWPSLYIYIYLVPPDEPFGETVCSGF